MALGRGMVVSRPITDVSYDRIVDLGGKITRVQIKMTSNKKGPKSWWVQTSDRNRKVYGDKIDVLAVYLLQDDVWMFIPTAEIPGSSMKLNVDGKAKRWINNWEVFNV